MNQNAVQLKIMHTADWHLGKRLHGHDLSDDHRLFFTWLLNTIQAEDIKLLLISGDIFDLANPSSEARKMYYEVLIQLKNLNCQVILTGGNHDSPSVLNASQALLRELQIHVVGGRPEEICDMVIPINDNSGKPLLAVAAVPFLRDADLRQMVRGEGHDDRTEAIREGIKKTFADVTAHCQTIHPGLPVIALGHLYTHGASTSDSEREIQVGNLAGFQSADFGEHFSYIALGHIHRPQRVGDTGRIYYSGSPIPLSFTEREDLKRVMILELSNGAINERSLPIPKMRALRRISGNLENVKLELGEQESEQLPLKTLLELDVIEQKPDPRKVMELEDMAASYQNEHAEIVKHRIRFTESTSGTSALYEDAQHIEDLSPKDVFERRMEHEELDEEQRKMLLEAFSEVIESLQQEEQ